MIDRPQEVKLVVPSSNGLTTAETVWYYVWCVLTLGGFYFTKLLIKKAVYEAVRSAETQKMLAAATRRD